MPKSDFTKKEQDLIQEHYRQLRAKMAETVPEEGLELIDKSFDLANRAHNGVKRKSGEPYMLHPIAVADIVSDMIPNDAQVVACSLLHDVVEDTDHTIEEMHRKFGAVVAQVIEGLTKLESFEFKGDSLQAANFEKLLLTIEKDIRTIYIKLADRLHNMQTLDAMAPKKQQKIASETLYFYAPIAERLGLYNYKTKLEDLAFSYLDPENYELIKKKRQGSLDMQAARIEEFKKPIADRLDQIGVKYTFEDRIKTIYSIWKKMQQKNVTFEEVYDLLAIRIVFEPVNDIPESTQCWFIYSQITDLYAVLRERTRDWVSSPKVNGYESLQCTLQDRSGNWVEVQIRTTRMHKIAESGEAAHWKYKGKGMKPNGVFDSLKEGISQIRDASPSSSKDFVDLAHPYLLAPQIVIYDANNQHYNIERGATVLDAAYAHLGKAANQAIGARVNGKLTNLDTRLNGGDKFELITAKSQHPSAKWLDYVRTARARSAINEELEKEQQNLQKEGKTRVRRICDELNIKFDEELLSGLLKSFELLSINDLYTGVVEGTINPVQLKKSLSRGKLIWKIRKKREQKARQTKKKGKEQQERKIEEHRIEYKPSPCCLAIPGDDVLFYKHGDTATVHRYYCQEARLLESNYSNRVTKGVWSASPTHFYRAYLEVEGVDRTGLLADLFEMIRNRLTVNVTLINFKSQDEMFGGVMGIEIQDVKQLEQVIREVKSTKGVRHVLRLSSQPPHA